MSDVLIRNLSDDVVMALDARAKSLGVSRVEYLRRLVVRDISVVSSAVTVDDLTEFSDRYADLDNTDVMAGAWD